MAANFFARIIPLGAAPFSTGRKVERWLVVLFLVINALVFYNALAHDPRIGYDSTDHLKYLETLSQGRLPGQADTREFFVPPAPYALGALARAALGISTYKAARLAQVVNGFLSAALLFLLLKVCLLINPRPAMRFGALSAMGILPVYYRSFALVRGEPYLAFFALLALYLALKLAARQTWKLAPALALGVCLGLAVLSRQWGFFLFPPLGLLLAWEFARHPRARWAILRSGLAIFLTAALLAAPFYASLYLRYGSLTAFNRSSEDRFSFANQPAPFYFDLALSRLFTQPVRPNFANRLWPILYADTWGDYWAYFTISGWDTRASTYLSGMKLLESLAEGAQHGWLETNYETFPAYLGRVNAVALFPTLLTACAILCTLLRLTPRPREDAPWERKALAFTLLTAAFGLAGYAWFWIQYPNDRGDTIKATYILQLYPCLALLLGGWLARVERKNARLYSLLLLGLGLTAAHNLPAMLTHYILR